MIIKEKMYECPKCKKIHFFDTSTNYQAWCKQCQCSLIFLEDITRDTELEEQRKNLPPYDPTKDPNSPYYIPVIKCPICGSTNVNKITVTSRAVKTAVFGVIGAVDDAGKTYKCGKCGSKF